METLAVLELWVFSTSLTELKVALSVSSKNKINEWLLPGSAHKNTPSFPLGLLLLVTLPSPCLVASSGL